MPRKFEAGLKELLARRDKKIRSRTTLEIQVNTKDVIRSYYLATSALTFRGVEWQPLLKRASQIQLSLTKSSDRATLEMHNADTAIGKEFLSLGKEIYNAPALVGRYWKDDISGAEYHETFLTGGLTGLQVAEDVVILTVVSEPYLRVSVGASRRVTYSCQWNFRQADTCGYNGAELKCNFLLEDGAGCQGRHGSDRFAKFGGDPFIDSRSRFNRA